MSCKQWFSYDPTFDGFQAHSTREAARAESTEGWDETVNDVCWGEIVERTVETSRLEVPDGVTVDRRRPRLRRG